MRTTLALDDDAFILAQQTALRAKISMGKAVSMLIRQSTQMPVPPTLNATRSRYSLIPADGQTVITSQDVYRLMEQEGI
jgi:hypothetical protein